MFHALLPGAVAHQPSRASQAYPRYPSERIRWRLARRNDLLLRLAYVVLAFTPIAALALDAIGLLPLATTTLFVILPALGVDIILSIRFPTYGKLALKGLVIGLIATLLYDTMRVPFILSGVWSDFIHKISIALLHTAHPNWLIGYTWRYIGDGGFLAIVFTMAYGGFKTRLDVRKAAVGFGVAIWVCLLLTLAFTPRMQAMLFTLTPTTFSLSLLGHLIYGTALGVLLHWWGWGQEAPRRSWTGTRRQAILPARAIEREAATLRCAQCSERLPEWARFCGHCGAKLSS